jgi:general secretion pathway protein C
MEEIKTQNNHSSITIDKSVPTKKRREEKRESKEIVTSEDGDSKIVSKGLLTSYTQDINKIWRDIGIGEHQTDGVIDGFKVNFVKKGSDFEKLGLKSGDILRSINGEELNSYGTAYNFYRGIENVDSLTIGITRDNHDMELEYEIH